MSSDINLGLGPQPLCWPPPRGLLAPDWMALPRSHWTKDHWRAYAELLEREGHLLLQLAQSAEKQAFILAGRLQRRKPSQSGRGGLLEAWDALGLGRKRGRPKGSRTKTARAKEALAMLAIQIKAESAQAGRHMHDKEALSIALERQGFGRWRAAQGRHLANLMSKLRRTQASEKNR